MKIINVHQLVRRIEASTSELEAKYGVKVSK